MFALIIVFSIFLTVVDAGKTRGNAGQIGGAFLVGSPPAILKRFGYSLDGDGIERDAHAVYGFMCQSSALKGEVFQVGHCADKAQKGDGCGIYYETDGFEKWRFFASASDNSWCVRSFEKC